MSFLERGQHLRLRPAERTVRAEEKDELSRFRESSDRFVRLLPPKSPRYLRPRRAHGIFNRIVERGRLPQDPLPHPRELLASFEHPLLVLHVRPHVLRGRKKNRPPEKLLSPFSNVLHGYLAFGSRPLLSAFGTVPFVPEPAPLPVREVRRGGGRRPRGTEDQDGEKRHGTERGFSHSESSPPSSSQSPSSAPGLRSQSSSRRLSTVFRRSSSFGRSASPKMSP